MDRELAHRTDSAVADAAATTRRSAMLVAATHRLREGGYPTACAWCGALGVGNEFFDAGEEPVFLLYAKRTHGICPRCLAELRRTGRSN